MSCFRETCVLVDGCSCSLYLSSRRWGDCLLPQWVFAELLDNIWVFWGGFLYKIVDALQEDLRSLLEFQKREIRISIRHPSVSSVHVLEYRRQTRDQTLLTVLSLSFFFLSPPHFKHSTQRQSLDPFERQGVWEIGWEGCVRVSNSFR